MRPFGIHLQNKNGIADDDIRRWASVKPGLVVITDNYWNLIPSLRQVIPGIKVIGRTITSPYGNSWNPDFGRMREYGRWGAEQAERYDLDWWQPYNEPTVEWPGGDAVWSSYEGYVKLAQFHEQLGQGFLATGTQRGITSIPLSPGHRENDDLGWGYRGYDIMASALQIMDLFNTHIYWPDRGLHLHKDFGLRFPSQLEAARWTGLWAISEWNSPVRDGDNDRRAIANEAREWLAECQKVPQFNGAAWFLWRSGGDFDELQMHDNPFLIDVATDMNHTNAQETPMPNLFIQPIAPVAPGGRGTVEFSIDAEAPGLATVIVHLPRKPDDTAYAIDPVTFVGKNPFTTNRFTASVDIPQFDIPGPMTATVQVNYIGFLGGSVYAPANVAEMTIDPNAGQGGGPPPITPGLPAQYDLVWQWAGDTFNAAEQVRDEPLKQAALNIQGHIRFLKGEVASDPLTARR